MTDEQKIFLDKVVQEGKKRLIAGYDRTGRRASGEFEKELSGEATERIGGFTITFKSAPHAYWMDKGRKPNKNQDPEAIRKWVGWYGSTVMRDWVNRKGVNANPYAVAHKVATKGYEAKPFIDEAINKDWAGEQLQGFAGLYLSIVKNDVVKLFKKK
jgi:hypothetical protein